jgi:hypothetical protein
MTVAVERWRASVLNSTVAEPPFGDVHGVAEDVGPHTEKVTVPVGEPFPALPTTVAVSLTVSP